MKNLFLMRHGESGLIDGGLMTLKDQFLRMEK